MNFYLKRHLLRDKKVKELRHQHKNADLWACVAASMFGVPYESCLEYDSEGNPNPEGKVVRTFAKRLVIYTLHPEGGFYKLSDLLLTSELEAVRDIVEYSNSHSSGI